MDDLPPPPPTDGLSRKQQLLAVLLVLAVFVSGTFWGIALSSKKAPAKDSIVFHGEGDLAYYESQEIAAPMTQGTNICYSVDFYGKNGLVAIIDQHMNKINLGYFDQGQGCYVVPFTGHWYFFVMNQDHDSLHVTYTVTIIQP